MNPLNALKKLFHHPEDSRDRQRIAIALARGGALLHKRRVDLANPGSWEFSGFSQHGDDGILDVLLGQLQQSDRTCVEIGSGDGVENNTCWLVVAEKFCGLMVEGDPWLARRTRRNIVVHSIGSACLDVFVTRGSVVSLIGRMPSAKPDVFSLDIDGNDYHIMATLFGAGFRPKIIVVEYNAVFGSDRSLTIEYRDDFVLSRSHPSRLAYGVSMTAWKRLMTSHGYRFVTVERSGVNSFFVDPSCFDAAFLDGIRGLSFAENRYQLAKFGMAGDRQLHLLAGEKFLEV